MFVRFIISIFVTFTAILPIAAAGGLGDFSSSVDRDREQDQNNDNSSSNNRNQNSSSCDNSGHWYEEEEDDSNLADDIMVAILTGYRPNENFSFGLNPYDGRRYLASANQISSAEELIFLSTLEEENRHFGYLRTQIDRLGIVGEPTNGFAINTRLESTYTPGIRISYFDLRDQTTSDRLNKISVMLEPRVWVGAHSSWHYSMGYVHYGTQNGGLNEGILLGTSFEFYFMDPWFLDARIQWEFMEADTETSDMFLGFGAHIIGPLTAQLGYRQLSSKTVKLNMFHLGFGLNLGI